MRTPDVLSRLKTLIEDRSMEDSELANAIRQEVPTVVAFVEKSMEIADKARELLQNAYSTPDDSNGIRIQSGDAVKLQWALHELAARDDDPPPENFDV